VALTADHLGEATGGHVVQLYDHDDELAAGVVPYLAEAIRAGGTALVIATEAHRQAFTVQLERAVLNPWSASATLTMLDAREAADALLFDGGIARHRFDKLIGELVREAAGQGGGPLRAYGEIVALLWADGHVRAALELEELWNDLAREVDFSLYCAYPRAWVEAEGEALDMMCRLHSAVVDPSIRPETAPALPCGLPSELEARFPWGGRSPSQARHFVVDTLAAWGYRARLDDAALITTEMATNAVLHAQTGFSVVVSRRAEGTIRIAVRDASLVRPRPRRAGPLETSGRGLRLVSSLAVRWGSVHVPEGKEIWAELPGEPAVTVS
jgi:hypothetical protein